jgi:hypothetical protein
MILTSDNPLLSRIYIILSKLSSLAFFIGNTNEDNTGNCENEKAKSIAT